MSSQPRQDDAGAPAARSRSRLLSPWLLVLLALVVIVTAGLGWYGWRRTTVPLPPEVHVAEDDPALAGAVAAARDRVLREPSSPAAWGNLGKLLRASQFVPEAVVCFAQAERLDPDNPRWPYLRGEGLILRDPEAALPHLRRAAALAERADPDNIAPRLRLAEVLLARGQHDEAEAHLRRAVEMAPDEPVLHLDLGLLAYARGKLEVSRAHLLRCCDSPFTRKKACARLAAVAQRQGKTAEASACNTRAAALPADQPWIDPYLVECQRLAVSKPERFRRIEQLEEQGRRQEAVALLGELVQSQPDSRAYIGLGKNLGQLGDYAGAEQALRTALQLSPRSAQAHYYLGKVFWARAEQRWQKGEDRSQAEAWFRTAAEHARQVLALRSDHAMAHLLLGLCLLRLGQRAEALTSLTAAVQCSPDLSETNLRLGEALAEAGRVDEARGYLEQAARLASPDDPRPRAALARLPAAKQSK